MKNRSKPKLSSKGNKAQTDPRQAIAKKQSSKTSTGPSSVLASSSSKLNNRPASVTDNVAQLQPFLRGASAAQKVQIEMITQVFTKMDADGDGLLSMNDVRLYFRAIGRNSSDLEVRKWINSRDIDQDGAVCLSEFVASYSLQLDPRSMTAALDGHNVADVKSTNISNIAVAFGLVRLGCTVHETVIACEAAEAYVRRILDSPTDSSHWSISVEDVSFHKHIGRLFGGVKLMVALGFHLEQNGRVLTVAYSDSKGAEVVSAENRKSLNRRLEELQSHRSSLQELTVSNIAAGFLHLYFVFYLINHALPQCFC